METSTPEALTLILGELRAINGRLGAIEERSAEDAKDINASLSGMQVALGTYHDDAQEQKESFGEQLERLRESDRHQNEKLRLFDERLTTAG